MARAVVHDLEVVDVHEHHRDGPGSSIRAVQGVRHPIQEERAVGQSGQRVMEGLMTELLLEGTAIGDITTIADNGTDVGVAEEIGEDRLELAPASVDMKEPRLEMGSGPRPTAQHVDEMGPCQCGVVGMGQRHECLAEQFVST